MTCPICARATFAAYKPFCSRRCADVDLGRWLTGGYVLPGPDLTEEDAAVSRDDDGGGDGDRPAARRRPQ